jgi:hypothetical protein
MVVETKILHLLGIQSYPSSPQPATFLIDISQLIIIAITITEATTAAVTVKLMIISV